MPQLLNTREAGFVTIFCADGGRVVKYGMSGCVHCGGQFPTPRMGTSDEDKATRVGRGFCQNCNGYVCGKGCAECIPVDLLLENMEKGRPEDYRPIIVPAGE